MLKTRIMTCYIIKGTTTNKTIIEYMGYYFSFSIYSDNTAYSINDLGFCILTYYGTYCNININALKYPLCEKYISSLKDFVKTYYAT